LVLIISNQITSSSWTWSGTPRYELVGSSDVLLSQKYQVMI